MFNQIIEYINEKLENILKIGKYTNTIGSDRKLQEVQLKTLRNIEDALKVGQFGFNSKAPLESRCVVARIGNESIVIANEHIASIIDVASGDSVVYNQNGDFIKVEKDKITIQAKTIQSDCTDFTINTTNFTVNASASAFTGTITANGTTIDDTHTHAQGPDSAGNSQAETNPPS